MIKIILIFHILSISTLTSSVPALRMSQQRFPPQYSPEEVQATVQHLREISLKNPTGSLEPYILEADVVELIHHMERFYLESPGTTHYMLLVALCKHPKNALLMDFGHRYSKDPSFAHLISQQ